VLIVQQDGSLKFALSWFVNEMPHIKKRKQAHYRGGAIYEFIQD
jgi:hypothetical protein